MKLSMSVLLVSLFATSASVYAEDRKTNVGVAAETSTPIKPSDPNDQSWKQVTFRVENGQIHLDGLLVHDAHKEDTDDHGGMAVLGHVGPQLLTASLGGASIKKSKNGKSETVIGGSILLGLARLNDTDGSSIYAWQPISGLMKYRQQFGEQGEGRVIDVQADAGYLINAQWNIAPLILIPVLYPEHTHQTGYVYHLSAALSQQLGESTSIGAYAVYEGGSITSKISNQVNSTSGQLSVGVKASAVID